MPRGDGQRSRLRGRLRQRMPGRQRRRRRAVRARVWALERQHLGGPVAAILVDDRVVAVGTTPLESSRVGESWAIAVNACRGAWSWRLPAQCRSCLSWTSLPGRSRRHAGTRGRALRSNQCGSRFASRRSHCIAALPVALADAPATDVVLGARRQSPQVPTAMWSLRETPRVAPRSSAAIPPAFAARARCHH